MRIDSSLRLAFVAAALLAAALPLRAQVVTTRGEVVRVERTEGADSAGNAGSPGPRAGRLTLKHAEIKNLDMPPMTMVFHAANAELLQGLSAGDRVRFTAERIEGRYTVTSLYKTP